MLSCVQGIPEIVVFFSPSGVQFTAHLIKRGMIPLQKIKVSWVFDFALILTLKTFLKLVKPHTQGGTVT